MKTYPYIIYYGKNEVIVNEEKKPEIKYYSERNKCYFDADFSIWNRECKTIPIADNHSFEFRQYAMNKLGSVKTMTESGIQIPSELVEIRQYKMIDGVRLEESKLIAHFVEYKNETQETNVANLRNQLTPLYGLANIVLAYNDNPEIKEIMIKSAKQAVESQNEIHRLLKLIESK